MSLSGVREYFSSKRLSTKDKVVVGVAYVGATWLLVGGLNSSNPMAYVMGSAMYATGLVINHIKRGHQNLESRLPSQ